MSFYSVVLLSLKETILLDFPPLLKWVIQSSGPDEELLLWLI